MSITVYHSTPDKIDVFNVKDGVHLGGYYSALEAGYRKLEKVRYKEPYEDQEHLYMHTCLLELDKVYLSDDVGGYAQWLDVIEEARKDGCTVIKYHNKYEPDSVPSYLVLDENALKLIKVEKLDESFVLNQLDSCWQTGSFKY